MADCKQSTAPVQHTRQPGVGGLGNNLFDGKRWIKDSKDDKEDFVRKGDVLGKI